MEFTYNGLVRYGFGFANPNHAAAFICMLLPILWGIRNLINHSQIKYKKLFWSLSFIFELLLYVGLIFTYSRTGFFVLIISALSYLYLCVNHKISIVKYFKKYAIFYFLIIGLFIILGFFTGVINRYFNWIGNLDGSILNRFKIWQGACQLIYDNPLGTSTGYSLSSR